MRLIFAVSGFYIIQLCWSCDINTGRTTDIRAIEWKTYENPKYGFFLDIPAGWDMRTSIHGIEIRNPATGKIYRVQALPDESETFIDPTPDYMIQRYAKDHPYLSDSLPSVNNIQSANEIRGFQLRSFFNRDYALSKNEDMVFKQYRDSTALLTYYPSVFVGDQYTNAIELFTPGSGDTVYRRMVASFGYLFPMLSESDLLREKLIDSSERPFESVRYVGETQGFHIDIDGDSIPELLIIGFYRLPEIGEAKCFFRLMRRTETGYVKLIQEYYLENSFNRTDIQVGNLNDKPGYEILIRFSDYGSPWGSNSTALIHYDSNRFKIFEFGAFAEIRDVDMDGKDEIVKSVNTQFSLGAISTWYDVYTYRNGTFEENNAAFADFYRSKVIPQYREQIILARNEIMETNVDRIRLSLYYLVRRLDRYIRAAEQLAQGKPLQKS